MLIEPMVRRKSCRPCFLAFTIMTFLAIATSANASHLASPALTRAIATIDTFGGPDSGFYRFVDSHEANGPTYSWLSPSASATTIAGWTRPYAGTAGPFNIGFTFPFYGRSYTQFYVGVNGNVTFGAGANSVVQPTGTVPFANYPTGVYLWQMEGFLGYSSSRILYERLTNPARLVVTFDSVPRLGNNTQRITGQIILFQSGEVFLNYRTVADSLPFRTAGIQDSSGLRGLAYPIEPTYPSTVKYYQLGQATRPVPADSLAGVPTNCVLSWSAAPMATGYRVHLGVTNPPSLVIANNASNSYNTGTLTANTRYYWQIGAYNATSTNYGPIWTFVTGSGSSANPPSIGSTSAPTPHSIQIRWSDQSANETGFRVMRTLDTNRTFTFAGDVAANVTVFTDSGLSANTHYFYRVFSLRNDIASLGWARAEGWTAATIPAVPLISSIRTTSGLLTVHDNLSDPNPAYTKFAINVNDAFVQSDGTLGDTTRWQTLSQWTSIRVRQLLSSTHFVVKVKARNGANLETTYSDTVGFTTLASYPTPFTETFTDAEFPPGDWRIDNFDNSVTWDRFFNQTTSCARMRFRAYPTWNALDYLWTAPIRTDSGAVILRFRWYYFGGSTQNDTLEILASLDNGLTQHRIWLRSGQGVGSEDLQCGNQGGLELPPLSVSDWRTAEIWLPSWASNVSTLVIGFLSHNRGGPDLFIDDISITTSGLTVLNGRVVNSTNQGVEGAIVSISDQLSTITGTSGMYNFQLPSGSYPFTISRDCMLPLIDSMITLASGQINRVDTLYTPVPFANSSFLELIARPGQTTSDVVNIANTGDYPLSIHTEVTTLQDRLMKSGRGKNHSNRRIIMGKAIDNLDEVSQMWGPDSGFYIARDTEDGTYYSWIDIASTGTEIWHNRYANDDVTLNVPLGFTFPFYDTTTTTCNISANAWLTFGQNSAWVFPQSTFPSNFYMITGRMTDNAHTATSRYIYQTLSNPTRFVASFYDVRYADSTLDSNSYRMTYQIILYPSGDIRLNYRSLGAVAQTQAHRAGIDDRGNGGIQIWGTTILAHPQRYSVEFTRGEFNWVTVSPIDTVITPGQSVNFTVRVAVPNSANPGETMFRNVYFTNNSCTPVNVPVMTTIVSAPEGSNAQPVSYQLHQNYPNPFNPVTEIRFDLKHSGMTRLTVYNEMGQLVTRLVDENLRSGYHSISFQASQLPSGIYFYRLESGSYTAVQKMVLLK